ncbi:hypothetical protein BKI52_33035 [marine bacterium AO1-C]|nr:hypothetical protein BKI52_33035 [marine bacterium AO1-C]
MDQLSQNTEEPNMLLSKTWLPPEVKQALIIESRKSGDRFASALMRRIVMDWYRELPKEENENKLKVAA